jgi:hypothetical protein
LARGDSDWGGRAPHRRGDHVDAVAKQPGALAQRQWLAFDDDVRPIMRPIVAGRRRDAPADPLADPVILARAEEMAVPRQYLLADLGHLRRRYAGVDVDVSERAVEPGDVLFEAERPAAEAAGHVEDRVALQEALVAERDHDFALADELAIEPGDALIVERHGGTLP